MHAERRQVRGGVAARMMSSRKNRLLSGVLAHAAVVLVSATATPAWSQEVKVAPSVDWSIDLSLTDGRSLRTRFRTTCMRGGEGYIPRLSRTGNPQRSNIQLRTVEGGGAVQITVPEVCSPQEHQDLPGDLVPFIVWFSDANSLDRGAMAMGNGPPRGGPVVATVARLEHVYRADGDEMPPPAVEANDPYAGEGMPYDVGRGRLPMVCAGFQVHRLSKNLSLALLEYKPDGANGYWSPITAKKRGVGDFIHNITSRNPNDLLLNSGHRLIDEVYGWAYDEGGANLPGPSGEVFKGGKRANVKKIKTETIPVTYTATSRQTIDADIKFNDEGWVECYTGVEYQGDLVGVGTAKTRCLADGVPIPEAGWDACRVSVGREIFHGADQLLTPIMIRVR